MGIIQSRRRNLDIPLLQQDYYNNSFDIVNDLKQNVIHITEDLNELKASYNTNIYSLNEKQMIINKDLQLLLNNDKLLLKKIKNIEDLLNEIKEIKNSVKYENIDFNNIQQETIKTNLNVSTI